MTDLLYLWYAICKIRRRFEKMKNVKRAISLMLAVALSLTLVGSYTDAFSVSAAGEDDLTGWEKGDYSTLTGNPEDGWKLSFTGGNEMVRGNFYTAETAASRLQIKLDLSTLESGGGFFLQLGDQKYTGGTWNDTAVGFYLNRNDDTTLEIQGFDASKSWPDSLLSIQKIENFDFAASHIFEFQDKNGIWNVVIDDTVLTGDQVQAGVVRFMEGMGSKEKTVIGILPNSWTTYEIRNISFLKKQEDNSDLTGWTLGATSRMTGNPEEGWQLDFTGLRFPNNGTSYKTDMDVSKLQVKFNISDLAVGKSIILQLANLKGSFENGDPDRVNFTLEKQSDTTFVFYGLDVAGSPGTGGILNYHRIEDFDYSSDHVFEFVKDNDQWLPALDGNVLWGNPEVYDSFVNHMTQYFAGSTTVSFAPNCDDDTVLTVKNINFAEKQTDPTDADWVKMNGVTVTGDQESGYDVTGKEYLTAYYRHPLKAADTTLNFRLSIADTKWNTLALAENMGMPLLPRFEEMKEYKGMAFILERKGDDLSFQVWEGTQIYQLKLYKSFDFDGVHTLTFANEHGNWYAVFDGEVLRSRQLNDLVSAMMTAEDGVHYRFSACYDDWSFSNVKFLDTPKDAAGTSNWDVTGFEMAGNGDDLTFKGDGYASYKQQIDLKETSIEVQFKPSDGGWAGLTISDMHTVGAGVLPGNVVPEDDFNALSFIMGRQNDTQLRISLFGSTPDGALEKVIAVVDNFDFDAAHKLRFVEKNGQYYLAIDGDILEWPEHDGEESYITNAITSLLSKLDSKVYLRFLSDQVSGMEWNHIAFVKEEFTRPGIYTNGAVTTTVTKNGLSVTGAGLVGINSPFDVQKNKLRVQFKPQNENWVLLTIGDTPSGIVSKFWGPNNKHSMMCFVLGRQNDNQLRLSMWDGEKELMLIRLDRFDFDAEHTFSFVQHRGKYYLAIDDRMIEAVAMDGGEEIVTSWITKAVKQLSKSTAYVRFACMNDAGMELSRIRWEGVRFDNVSVGVSPATGDTLPVIPASCASTLAAFGMVIAGNRIRRKKRAK